jgi:hypothetical protein
VSAARTKGANSKSRIISQNTTNLPLYPITYSSLRSFYTSWDGWGMSEALQRAICMLHNRFELPLLPRWLHIVDFPSALHHMTVDSAKKVIPVLRDLEEVLRVKISKLVPHACAWQRAKEHLEDGKVPGLSETCAVNYESQRCMVCAIARMQYGATLEAVLSLESLIMFGIHQRSRGSKFGRICSDACKVAAFTSAHAEYVNDVQNGLEEPCLPSLLTVASVASELDLSDLLQRQGRVKGLKKVPATIVTLLHKLQTSTLINFETILKRSIKECPCLKTLITNSYIVSASGLHEHLHPAIRPPWCERFIYIRIIKHSMSSRFGDFCSRCYSATREVLRRNVIDSYASLIANKRAMASRKIPIGLVCTPPFKAPEWGLECCQRLILEALRKILEEHAMTRDGRSMSPPHHPPSSFEECFLQQLNSIMSTSMVEWLSKPPLGTLLKPSFVNVAGEMWLAAHRAVASPMYVHAYAHGHRLSRFDTSLHRAALDMNALSKLVNTLTERQLLCVQNLALNDPQSGVLSMEEIGTRLGIQVRGIRGVKNLHEVLNCIPNGEAAAMLFAYARVAWLKEEMLTIDLGPISARKQTIGALRRLSHPMLQEALDTPVETFNVAHFTAGMPVHAHTLFLCAECRRICNATHVDGLRSGVSFNELGLSSCMVCRESDSQWHLRCARRASAALRTAQSAENATLKKRLTELEPNKQFRAFMQLDQLDEAVLPENYASRSLGEGVCTVALPTLHLRKSRTPFHACPVRVSVWVGIATICPFGRAGCELLPRTQQNSTRISNAI